VRGQSPCDARLWCNGHNRTGIQYLRENFTEEYQRLSPLDFQCFRLAHFLPTVCGIIVIMRHRGGSAVVNITCKACGKQAMACYSDTGRVSCATFCANCGLQTEAEGLSRDGRQRTALLEQSGLWRLVVFVECANRPQALRALREVAFWTVERLDHVPPSGEVVACEGTYGECHSAATRFEQQLIRVRLDHVSGSMSGLLPPADELRFWRRWFEVVKGRNLRCSLCCKGRF